MPRDSREEPRCECPGSVSADFHPSPGLPLDPVDRRRLAKVVLLAPEAKDPTKHVPRALFLSLVAVTAVCAMASFSLSGALPAEEIDPDSAFAEAFRVKGMRVAHKVGATVVVILC